MKLSEAIREGSKKHPAAEYGWNDFGPDGEIRTCALLAAAEVYGLFIIENNVISRGPKWTPIEYGPNYPFDRSYAYERGPEKPDMTCRTPDEWYAIETTDEIPPCSCGNLRIPGEVFIIIWHLQDVHGWTREAVADWVEQAELRLDERQWIAAKGPGKPWVAGVKW